LWLFLGIALVLIIGGIFLWRYFSSYESTDDAQVDVHIYPVSARISGYVIAVNVGDNQYVQQGYVLVEIDPKDYQVAVDKAKADLASAEATARSLNINLASRMQLPGSLPPKNSLPPRRIRCSKPRPMTSRRRTTLNDTSSW
jgi:multidrug resistance efflux pump